MQPGHGLPAEPQLSMAEGAGHVAKKNEFIWPDYVQKCTDFIYTEHVEVTKSKSCHGKEAWVSLFRKREIYGSLPLSFSYPFYF